MKSKFCIRGKLVVVGIGNRMRGDDGFGPAVIQRLKEKKAKAVCIDAGSAPENYTGKIAKETPDTILLVDAVHLGLNPGEYRILGKSDIINSGLTTHDISPRMFIDYLQKATDAKIYMLGLQPKEVSLGTEMSDVVKESAVKVSELIMEAINA